MTTDPQSTIVVVALIAAVVGPVIGYAFARVRHLVSERDYFVEVQKRHDIEPWKWRYPVAGPADDVTAHRAVFVWDDNGGYWDMERWLPEDEWPLMKLAAELVETNRANGWDRYNDPDAWDEEFTVPSALCHIHAELSEALEDFRADDREHFGEELADVLIRLLDLAHGTGVDLDAEVARKDAINKERGYRHGGKRS